MSGLSPFCVLKRKIQLKPFWMQISAIRNVLSEAYLCDEAWQKRLESPILKEMKMNQYFVETDKKFGTKRLVSGVEVDMFANNVKDISQLDELEHLVYRFRRTKRSTEMMDSTNYAVIRTFLKFKQYESLFRILNNRDNYGVFPDPYSYNILMSTFLKENMFVEAAQIAVLMMLQEDFENKISCAMGIHSCQMFLAECSLESLFKEEVEDAAVEEEGKKEDEEDEDDVTLVRVPFLRNPWFADHFDITNPKHLIGKTLYLLGREVNNSVGRSCQIVGLAMYEKWDKAANLLKAFTESKDSNLLSETIERVKSLIDTIPDDEEKTKDQWMTKFDGLFQKMKSENKIEDMDFTSGVESHLNAVLQYQESDIAAQKKLFLEWEDQRRLALDKLNLELDKERRLKVIEEKKEYLHWKEQLLFFFENEDKNMEEVKKVEEIVKILKDKVSVEDSYVPPEIIKKAPERISKYKKLAQVKHRA